MIDGLLGVSVGVLFYGLVLLGIGLHRRKQSRLLIKHAREFSSDGFVAFYKLLHGVEE